MMATNRKMAYLRVPVGMPDAIAGHVTEALGRWEALGRPTLPPAPPRGRTRHLGGSMDEDQMRRLMEAGDGNAAHGATRLLLWMRGQG